MNNMNFRWVENIKEYLAEGIKNGEFQSEAYQKTGEITARAGKIGEEILTVMANGLQETRNSVKADENGNPDWVVTACSGEKYIVTDSVFKKKYEKIVGTEDGYRPVWNPINAVQIDEAISFIAPWGEAENLAAGGYLVFNKDYDDIYGVQKEEFERTYKKICL